MTLTHLLLVYLTAVWMSDSSLVTKNVLFRPINTITTSRSRWLLTLVYDVKPFLHFVSTLSVDSGRILSSVDEIITSYTNDNDTIEFKRTFQEVRRELLTLRNEIGELLTGLNDYHALSRKTRKKRALIPFIGKALSWLFGTVSSSDLNVIRNNINTLSKNQQVIKHVVTESLSILNVSRLEISNNRKQIHLLTNSLRDLDTKIQGIMQDFKRRIIKLEGFLHLYLRVKLVIDDIKLMMLKAELYAEEIKLQLNMLSLGHLSPSVIVPHKLRDLLLEIQDRLPPNVKLPADPKKNLWHYYKILTCISLIEDYKIIVVLNIPLLDNEDSFVIYKIHSLPVPLTSKHVISNSKATFKMVAKYNLETTTIAINLDKTKYSLLTTFEAEKCSDPVIGFCQIKSPIYPINLSKLCVIALFRNNLEKIHRLCKVSVKPNEILPVSEYYANGFWTVVVREPTRFSVICQTTRYDNTYIIVNPPIQNIHLDSTCKATNDAMTLPAHYSNESIYFDETSFRDLLHTFNESISDLWRPLTDTFGNYSLTKLPPKLRDLDNIPMKHLISEMYHLQEIKKSQITTWPFWKWALVYTMIAVCILILCLVFSKCAFPKLVNVFLGWSAKRDSKSERRDSGYMSAELVDTITPMITHEPVKTAIPMVDQCVAVNKPTPNPSQYHVVTHQKPDIFRRRESGYISTELVDAVVPMIIHDPAKTAIPMVEQCVAVNKPTPKPRQHQSVTRQKPEIFRLTKPEDAVQDTAL